MSSSVQLLTAYQIARYIPRALNILIHQTQTSLCRSCQTHSRTNFTNEGTESLNNMLKENFIVDIMLNT